MQLSHRRQRLDNVPEDMRVSAARFPIMTPFFPHPRGPQREIECAYHIPEPEPPLDLRPGSLNPSKCVLTNLQSHALGIFNPRSVRVSYSLSSVDVSESVQIHFGQDTKSGVDLCLEGQRKGDVQQVVTRPSDISAQ